MVACLVAAALLARPAWAVAFTVNSTTDAVDAAPGNGQCSAGTPTGGPCTLRAAIQEANALAGADSITLPAGTYTLTLVGNNEDAAATGDLDIGIPPDPGNPPVDPPGDTPADVTIRGAGAGSTVIDGNDTDRVLDMFSSLEISGTTIANGGGFLNMGGGIRNVGSLQLTDSALSSNTSNNFPGGGGLFNSGSAKLINSSVSDNTADISSEGGQGGGIFNSGSGTVELTNSTVSGNDATGQGGGIVNDSDGGTVTLTDSTVSDNDAFMGGGGISNSDIENASSQIKLIRSTVSGNSAISGGGVENFSGDIELIDSTVSGNEAFFTGGGISNSSGDTSGTSAKLTNGTVSGNTAVDQGGGISNSGGDLTLTNVTLNDNGAVTGSNLYNEDNTVFTNLVEGTATVKNTIVANSRQGSNCADPTDGITSSGNNLDDDGSCGFNQPSDINNQDPRLGPLADNGGPTQTHALLTGSPAIDKADNAACPAADQRGVTRPQDGDGNGTATCDIGAFETPAVPPAPPTPPTPTTPDDCTITGTEGDDVLEGTSEDDVICGLGGNDTIKGKRGNDTILGGTGNDTISAGRGKDTVYGGDGRDSLSGDRGGDTLIGGSRDPASGSSVSGKKEEAAARDVLDGGAGKDRCEAGPSGTERRC